MLTTIRTLRVLVGLIAVWQVLGLLPVFTWLSNLHAVTVGMWMTAAIKSFFMVLCGGVYFWLGTVRNRIDDSGKATSEGRIIIVIMLLLTVLGIVLAIIISAISDRDQEAENTFISPNQTTTSNLSSNESNYSRPPDLKSEGWTQESTGSNISGPWLDYDPPGTRYSRMADGKIYRFFPPGVRPNAEKANPFGLDVSSDRPPSN